MSYQRPSWCLFEDVVNVTEGIDRSAGARWSASAAAFTAWRDGDPSALEELVRLVSPTLWHVVRATGLDRATAEDVVQNTWLALVDSAERINEPMAVAGWLCTTARREAWRVSKRTKREVATTDDALGWALPSMDGPEDGLVLAEDQARLRLCLSRLNDRCQALLRMLAAGPRPEYAEVSDALDMPIGSIGPTRARCLDKLRNELISEGAL
jgi:RNA polymerase sigma factor (sigma-70 family)